MAKARKILARRNAIRSIHTVTRTMEMVATARFKRAHSRAVSARRYIDGMQDLLDDLIARSDRSDLDHPLLQRSERSDRVAVVLITSDRGLCGGYNAALLKQCVQLLDRLHGVDLASELHVAGKKGATHLRHDGRPIEQTYPAPTGDPAEWHAISRLADTFMQRYLGGELRAVEIVYSAMAGSNQHVPTTWTLLPLELLHDEPPEQFAEEADDWGPLEPPKPPELRIPYEFMPDPRTLYERLVPMAVRLRFFQCFLEAAVTEQLARMSAMRAASDNAEEMIDDLTIQYNHTRQSQITTELAEIIGGAAAIE